MNKPKGFDDQSDLKKIQPYLAEEVRERLTRDSHEKGKWLCPFCGSGTGKKKSGAFSINSDKIHWKCFACDKGGDIFDLVAEMEGVTLSEATQELLDKYGDRSRKTSAQTPGPKQPEQQDFSETIRKAHAALKDSAGAEYFRRRGITDQSMERFNLGFAQDDLNRPAIVMPHDREGTYYTTRTILEDVENKHRKPKDAKSILYNAAALWQPEPCFVVESQLCAISIMQEGGSALALAGTSGKTMLLSLLDQKKPNAVLILALDNDQPGQKAQAELAEGLKEREIPFIQYNVAADCKDPNELLQRDPSALHGSILAAKEVVAERMKAEADRERETYQGLTTAASFSRFTKYLMDNAGRPPIPTGFSSLDKILNGGLTSALYIMGAISSLGKTSWMLNIADNIAAAGNDVLYFSLEMSSHELIAKSISRISFQEAGKHSRPLGEAFSTFEVLNSQGAGLTMMQTSALQDAMKIYCETIGQHMWITSGINNISVDDVTKAVEEHIRITGRRPVVFIDYLQILAPEDIRSTDKQNTDRAVVQLKNMSATHDIPVFCISSLNRMNYNEPISMAAFKESGAIEYGSDVLIGLQLYGIDRKKGEKDNDRAVRVADIMRRAEDDSLPADLEVKVLKNRNGSRGGSGRLLFDKKYNSFAEVPKDFTPVGEKTPFDTLPVI